MGGIVAKYLITLPMYKNNVKTIYTLSTPHSEPPLSISFNVQKFYDELNNFWKNNTESLLKSNMNIISIAAGSRDRLIDSHFAIIGNLIDPRLSLTAYTTGMPGCWASADHEGMVW